MRGIQQQLPEMVLWPLAPIIAFALAYQLYVLQNLAGLGVDDGNGAVARISDIQAVALIVQSQTECLERQLHGINGGQISRVHHQDLLRSEERRVGPACVSTFSSRLPPSH